MDDIYCYLADLPDNVHEIVTPCADGYTVWISNRLDIKERQKALEHAIEHIKKEDFRKYNVQWIEGELI